MDRPGILLHLPAVLERSSTIPGVKKILRPITQFEWVQVSDQARFIRDENLQLMG
jgi:hypothetical protein